MISIIDDIGVVVQAMRIGQYDSYHSDQFDKIGPPYFFKGHRKEIASKLSEKSNVPAQAKQKYPLIALNTMSITPNVRGDVFDFNLNIVIGVYADPNWSTEKREEELFKPILYPLYDSFIEKFCDAGLFFWEGPLSSPPHTPLIKYFWGTEDKEGSIKNIFNDPMSAIEIVNLKFSRQKMSC